MRRLAFALVLPLIAFGAVRAEAARISFAGADCGSDPLLGLTFTSPIPIAGGSVACDGFAFGSILDPGTGLPIYGPEIFSIGFTISNPTQIDGSNPLEVVDDTNDDDLATTSLGSGLVFTNSDGSFLVTSTTAGPIDITCLPVIDAPIGRALRFHGLVAAVVLEIGPSQPPERIV